MTHFIREGKRVVARKVVKRVIQYATNVDERDTFKQTAKAPQFWEREKVREKGLSLIHI